MKPHLHILGVGGTFMAGIATIAQQLGWHVTGSDHPLYPPMSDYLAQLDLTLYQGYSETNIVDEPDWVIVGNAVSRGNPELEAVLDRHWRITSGPQWLHDHVLRYRTVIAVAGTHGKTTTTSLIAWLLEANGQMPGFLIGGLANNFTQPARLGEGQYFVIEADEYDSAFFDKRSKFVHYWPDIAVLNNLEFDHADIFTDMAAIQRQFDYMLKTVPRSGQLIVNKQSEALQTVLSQGCWASVQYFNDSEGYHHRLDEKVANQLALYYGQTYMAHFDMPLWGEHNRQNVEATLLVGQCIGLSFQQCNQALNSFEGVKRRLEVAYQDPQGVTVYQDFAHHPTAIQSTIAAMREKQNACQKRSLYVAVDFGSYTMRNGCHSVQSMVEALQEADKVYLWEHDKANSELLRAIEHHMPDKVVVQEDKAQLARDLGKACTAVGADLLLMSNRNFANILKDLLNWL